MTKRIASSTRQRARVDDLDGALAQVAEGGAEIVGEAQDFDYGRFGWFLDPEGYKVELWQPKAS